MDKERLTERYRPELVLEVKQLPTVFSMHVSNLYAYIW